MFILQVIQIVGIFVSVNGECSLTSWIDSFNSKGQSSCQQTNYYIKGLERGPNNGDNDNINLLDGADCCSAPQQWSDKEVQVIYTDWTDLLGPESPWAFCPSGYFLQGLYRTDTSSWLYNIEMARCAQPVTHPFYYGRCYDEDINVCFNNRGRCSCREGYYVTGLYRGNGNRLYNLDTLRCCTMADGPQIVDNLPDLKARIMDVTLLKMANLASMLGFSWCAGNRGLNIGEDFERNGDTWNASKKLFNHQSECTGTKCNQRLGLAFGDWSIGVKEIIYGQSVIDELQPESIDTGTRYNRVNTKSTETFEISKTIQETVTHSATNSWSSSHELGISLNFNFPFDLGSSSVSYTFRYDTSSSTTNEQSTQNSRTFTMSTTKTLNANSSAKYNVIAYKTRTTIPYTAVMIARFSTEFNGVMKYGGSYGTSNTNYHYLYAGRSDRPSVNYRFGSSTLPFYEALKRESDSQSRPWLWNEMIRNNPTARQIIDSLTDETYYEFLLRGTLSKVAGTKIDVVWESVNIRNITRRQAPDINNVLVPNSNTTIKAVAGPNDPPPPPVVYPEVSLIPKKPFVPNPIPVEG